MEYQKYLVLGLIIASIVLISGCIQEESTPENILESSISVDSDPVIQNKEPYINEVIFDDVNLRAQAASIVAGGESGDKEYQINALYRYVVENFNYYSDPRSREFIQSPSETMKVKGGDCEDLTILLMSLLENLGIKTYIVFTEDHAYCLAGDVDTEVMGQYIQESIITQVSKDFNQNGNQKVIIEDGNLFVMQEKQQTFVLKSGNLYYYGGDGSEFTSPIEYLNMRYDISSSQPLSIYVVPSRNDYELMSEGRSFKHFPSYQKQNILKISDSCDGLTNYGGLILKNDNSNDATVDLDMKFYLYYSVYDFFENKEMKSYLIDEQTYIVLDATAGKYGYPGFGGNHEGTKTAIDPVTKEYIYLK